MFLVGAGQHLTFENGGVQFRSPTAATEKETLIICVSCVLNEEVA